MTLSKAKWPPTRGWKGHLVQQQYFPDPVSISQCAQTWFYSFTVIVGWCLLMTQWAIDLDVPYYMTRKWAIGVVRTSIPCAVDGRSPQKSTPNHALTCFIIYAANPCTASLPTYQKQRRMWGKNASPMDGKGGVLHVLVHLKLSPGVHATSTSWYFLVVVSKIYDMHMCWFQIPNWATQSCYFLNSETYMNQATKHWACWTLRFQIFYHGNLRGPSPQCHSTFRKC